MWEISLERNTCVDAEIIGVGRGLGAANKLHHMERLYSVLDAL